MATISILNLQSDLPIDCCDLPDAVHFILKFYKRSAHELTFHFIPCDEMRNLHKKYFDDDAPTDCIGFPLFFDSKLFGDIFICPKTAVDYAHKHRGDPHEELMRYVVHALLHFLGFEDLTNPASMVMRFQEDLTLKNVTKKGYALCPF